MPAQSLPIPDRGATKHPPPPRPGGLKALARRRLKAGRGFTQPDIWLVRGPDGDEIWKTWGRRPWIERIIIGRWLARREGRIIRTLQDLPGFPRFLYHPDPVTIAMTRLEAEPVPEVKQAGAVDVRYFDRLAVLLREMHRRGVNHGDLRRKNLLRAPGDPSRPCVVDFTQSLNLGRRRRGLRAWVFREAQRIDWTTFAKLKRWFLGEAALNDDDRRALEDVPWHLSAGRFLRKSVYRPYKHWRTGKRRTR